MFKVVLLAIVCCAMVYGNIKDDIRDKASEALHQGEKVKVRETNVVVRVRRRFLK